MKYTHLPIGQDIRSISGYYTPLKEVRLKLGEREVLYVVGQAILDSSCCGASSFMYAIVPGYIVKWQGEASAEGLPVSEVEFISGDAVKESVARLIRQAENATNIDFW